ncbi:hypothetical protein CONLIGDRAFT_630254 [Coniochaeta ligniaria NRRL 30616]|uniref:Sister chromatid cohesion protein DCC1 n=1 Tax=Coniochaeta ligniaria NRRL 30616 TaxID=1408157 RepID=A0A1J7JGV0_9PEZI|nr:hypothetical protein CONLIGDRAFT_630254 [Coniochaeta ligniaria NRRL 30616]
MSSQDNKGIPLSHAPNPASYKLLELPAELLELLESDNPPVLTLESSPTAALLKTPSKIYSLRQKNTSNALILLSPAAVPSTSSSTPPTSSSALPEPAGLNAIATVHETLELVPETGNATAPATVARGKWHERFAKGR